MLLDMDFLSKTTGVNNIDTSNSNINVFLLKKENDENNTEIDNIKDTTKNNSDNNV